MMPSSGNETQAPSQEQWLEAGASEVLNIAEMDALVQLSQDQWARYEELLKPAKEAKALYDQTEEKIIAVLKAAGKTSYKAEIGTFTITHTPQVTTPKTIEDKQKFFNYLKKTAGADVMWSYISVASGSLNTWYKEKMAEAEKNGTLMKFQVPGIDGMTTREALSFRAAKKTTKTKGQSDEHAN